MLFRSALRRGPIEDHFIALLCARKQFGALLHALDRRQGRPPFTATEYGKTDGNEKEMPAKAQRREGKERK